MEARLLFICTLWSSLASLSCSGDGPSCVQSLDLQCQPLYQPVYSEIFSRTLQPSCSVGTRCHSAEGQKAGLVFEELEASYANLLELGTILPGDASCSLLVRRIEGVGTQMPPAPADPLSEGERCAIEQWIANGAEL